jgi:hypothetical protein
VKIRLDNYSRFPGARTGPSCLLGDPELNPILAPGPRTGPSMLAQGVLRACSGVLRSRFGPAHPRLRFKRPLLRSQAVAGTGEKILCPTIGVFASWQSLFRKNLDVGFKGLE